MRSVKFFASDRTGEMLSASRATKKVFSMTIFELSKEISKNEKNGSLSYFNIY
jgi:hypothetical protein